MRSYAHEGHGPRAEQRAGYMSATSNHTPLNRELTRGGNQIAAASRWVSKALSLHGTARFARLGVLCPRKSPHRTEGRRSVPAATTGIDFPTRPLRCRLQVMASQKLVGPVYDRYILFLLHLRNVSGLRAHSVKPGADARIGRELKAAVFGRVRVGVERYVGDRILPGG